MLTLSTSLVSPKQNIGKSVAPDLIAIRTNPLCRDTSVMSRSEELDSIDSLWPPGIMHTDMPVDNAFMILVRLTYRISTTITLARFHARGTH